MEEKTLGAIAFGAYHETQDWQAVADAVVAADEARRWVKWPDETGEGEYPPDETPVEVYCGKWASKDRLISQISVKRGTYGPSGASYWRCLPAPPQEVECGN